MSEAEEKKQDLVKKEGTAQPEVVEEGSKRFVEKGPHVLLDTETEIYWMKKDSWLDKSKYFNWHESRDYADMKNLRNIGGFNDWRLPSSDEIKSLFDMEKETPGKSGVLLHIDPKFTEGSFKASWIMGDTSTKRPRFNFVEGKMETADEYAFGSVRLCRKGPVPKNTGRLSRGRR